MQFLTDMEGIQRLFQAFIMIKEMEHVNGNFSPGKGIQALDRYAKPWHCKGLDCTVYLQKYISKCPARKEPQKDRSALTDLTKNGFCICHSTLLIIV